MKKLILIIIFFINITPNINKGHLYIHAGQQVEAQTVPCPCANPPCGSQFWNAMGTFFTNIGNAIGGFFSTIGGAIHDFFSSQPGGGEEFSSEMPEFDWEPEPFLEQPDYQGGGGPYDPWNDPYYQNLFDYYNTYGGSSTPPPIDCFGVPNGSAYRDSCNKCVGGTTGKIACIKDCAGVWGGKSFKDSCNICIDSIRKQPCDSNYKVMGDSLYAFLQKPEFQDSLNKFKINTAADTVEKAISFGKELTTGLFKATKIKDKPDSGFGNYQINLINSFPGMKIFKMMHFHTSSGYACFSAGDFYSLEGLFAHSNYNQITSHYVYSAFDSSFFAMEIEDSTLYAKYVSLHPIGSTMDPITHGFDTATNIGKDFDKVNNYLYNFGGLNDDDARTQAMAFVMSKYNTGLVMFRQRKGENKFTKINTKENTNASGIKTYATSNCL